MIALNIGIPTESGVTGLDKTNSNSSPQGKLFDFEFISAVKNSEIKSDTMISHEEVTDSHSLVMKNTESDNLGELAHIINPQTDNLLNLATEIKNDSPYLVRAENKSDLLFEYVREANFNKLPENGSSTAEVSVTESAFFTKSSESGINYHSPNLAKIDNDGQIANPNNVKSSLLNAVLRLNPEMGNAIQPEFKSDSEEITIESQNKINHEKGSLKQDAQRINTNFESEKSAEVKNISNNVKKTDLSSPNSNFNTTNHLINTTMGAGNVDGEIIIKHDSKDLQAQAMNKPSESLNLNSIFFKSDAINSAKFTISPIELKETPELASKPIVMNISPINMNFGNSLKFNTFPVLLPETPDADFTGKEQILLNTGTEDNSGKKDSSSLLEILAKNYTLKFQSTNKIQVHHNTESAITIPREDLNFNRADSSQNIAKTELDESRDNLDNNRQLNLVNNLQGLPNITNSKTKLNTPIIDNIVHSNANNGYADNTGKQLNNEGQDLGNQEKSNQDSAKKNNDFQAQQFPKIEKVFPEIAGNQTVVVANNIKIVNDTTPQYEFSRVRLGDVPRRIMQLASSTASGSTQSAKLVMHPKSLGTIIVQISIADSVVKLNLKGDNKESLVMLESTSMLLKERFESKGLILDSIEYELNNTGNETYSSKENRNGQEKTNSRKYQTDYDKAQNDKTKTDEDIRLHYTAFQNLTDVYCSLRD